MSETKYILIYPFESQEKAFETANNIDGSLMWQNGNAYPNDNVPAFIIPLSEFGSRWTAPRAIEQANKDKVELVEALDDALHLVNIPDYDYGEEEMAEYERIRKASNEYRAKHKGDK